MPRESPIKVQRANACVAMQMHDINQAETSIKGASKQIPYGQSHHCDAELTKAEAAW